MNPDGPGHFPTFPHTSVAGVALIPTADGALREVSQVVRHATFPVPDALVPLPKGTMDDDGYFTFRAHGIHLRPAGEERITSELSIQALDGSNWITDVGADDFKHPRVYAVVLGWFQKFHPDMSINRGGENVRGLLLEEHEPRKFHVRSFFFLDDSMRFKVLTWPELEFCVGGPLEFDASRVESEMSQMSSENVSPPIDPSLSPNESYHEGDVVFQSAHA